MASPSRTAPSSSPASPPSPTARRRRNSAQALIGRTFGGGAADPFRGHLPLQPAADHRALHQRRLRVPARGAGGAGPGGDRQRDAGADRLGQPGPAARARVLHLHGVEPVGLSRHRPHQGAGARGAAVERVQHAASHARRAVRQQLQSLRPHLAGEHRGPGRRPERHLGALEHLRPKCDRPDGAAALDRECQHRGRAAGHHPLQQLPLGHRGRLAVTGHLVGDGAGGDGGDLGADAAAGLQHTNGPAPPIRSRPRQARPVRSSGSPCCSPICSSWRSTRAG